MFWYRGCASSGFRRLNKRGSYRNAGTGAGAGGRWTLYRNQRHSATRKRTPERKRQCRDQHSCSRGDNPYLNRGYFSSLVFLLSSVPMAQFDYSPAVSSGSDNCACANTSGLSPLVNSVCAGVSAALPVNLTWICKKIYDTFTDRYFTFLVILLITVFKNAL